MERSGKLQGAMAICLVALGLTVLAGWIFHIPHLVQVTPTSTGMVANTALCFALAGIALGLGFYRRTALVRALGAAILALAGTVLVENVLGAKWAIDLSAWHSWLDDGNPVPGRMAPNTALGFCLASLVLLLSHRVTDRATGVVMQFATFATLLIGLTGVVGYSLELEFLYGWFRAPRMAIHTAAGMCLLAIGLWSAWHRSAWYQTSGLFRDDERIGLIGVGILIVVALTAGIAGIAGAQRALEKSLSHTLLLEHRHRASVLLGEVDEQVEKLRVAAGRPDLIRLAADHHSTGQPVDAAELGQLAKGILRSGESGLALFDSQAVELHRVGRLAGAAAASAPAGAGSHARWLWDGEYRLRAAAPVISGGALVGVLVLEEALPRTTAMMLSDPGLGRSGEVGLCMPGRDALRCFPQHRSPFVYDAPARSANGKLTPAALAVRGKRGAFKGLDYRNNNVLAAHAPLGSSGLGLVVKQDTEELFAPVSAQLEVAVPLLLALVLAGAALLRSQLSPMARRLLESEHLAHLAALDSAALELEKRTLVDSVGDGIITIDEDGLVQFFNRAACTIFGHDAEEMIGSNVRILMPEDMRQRHFAGMARYLAGGEPRVIGKPSVTVTGLRKSGEVFPMELTVSEMQLGSHRQFIGIIRDITARREVEKALALSETRMRAVAGNIPALVSHVDKDQRYLFANAALANVFDTTPDAMLGKTMREVRGPEAYERVRQYVEAALRGEPASYEWQISVNGREVHYQTTYVPELDELGEVQGFFAIAFDITDRKSVEAGLNRLARLDSLTGVANRRELEERLDASIDRSRRLGEAIALLCLDIDHFKDINDAHGHPVGDAVIQEFAERLRGSVRPDDLVARLGGDEFMVLLERAEPKSGEIVASKILAAMQEPMRIRGIELPVRASIGVAYSTRPISASSLMTSADEALYLAKSAGRATHRVVIVDR